MAIGSFGAFEKLQKVVCSSVLSRENDFWSLRVPPGRILSKSSGLGEIKGE